MTTCVPAPPTDHDVPKSIEELEMLEYSDLVRAVTIGASSEHLFTCENHYVKVWDLKKIESIKTPLSCFQCLNGNNYLSFCKLLGDDSTMVVGGGADIILIYDLSAVTGRGGSASNSPSLTPNSNGSSTSPRIKSQLKLNAPACHSVAIDPFNSNLCYCCCSDGSIVKYDIHNQLLVESFDGHVTGDLYVDINPDGKTIATGGADNKVRCWDLRNNHLLLQEYTFDSKVSTLGYCPIGEWLAVGMDSGKIELLNISSSPEKKKFPEKYTVNISNDCPRLVKFSHHGKWFIAAGVKQSINYYRAPTGLSLFQSKQPSSALCCDIARDNTRIVTGLVNNTVKVFKIVY